MELMRQELPNCPSHFSPVHNLTDHLRRHFPNFPRAVAIEHRKLLLGDDSQSVLRWKVDGPGLQYQAERYGASCQRNNDRHRFLTDIDYRAVSSFFQRPMLRGASGIVLGSTGGHCRHSQVREVNVPAQRILKSDQQHGSHDISIFLFSSILLLPTPINALPLIEVSKLRKKLRT
jgi:hypothetical protein